jgi:hypothetical protein
MKKLELLGEVRADKSAGMTSSSSVTSQALRLPMLAWSPATPRTAAVLTLHVHASSRLEEARSSLPDLALLQDDIASPAIDLNRTPAPTDSTQATRKRARERPVATTLPARILFDEMPTPTLAESV